MKTVIALCLICAGAWILHTGWMKKKSLAGRAGDTIAQLGRAIDGETRIREHTWYFAGGGVVALVGFALLFSPRRG